MEAAWNLYFPVQFYVDPHFHIDHTLNQFGVTSWEKLRNKSEESLPATDDAAVTYVLQWAITNNVDPEKWISQEKSTGKLYETIGVQAKKSGQNRKWCAPFGKPQSVGQGEQPLERKKK